MRIGKWKIRRRALLKTAWFVVSLFAVASMVLGSVTLGLGSLR